MARKFLIADESDAVRAVAVNILRQNGHEVLTASGGAEAWEILKSGKVDLGIINSSLEGMDGYTLSKLVKEDSSIKDTKVVLLLATSEVVNQHKLITASPDGTLSKPFAPPDLLEKASEVLGEKLAKEPKKKENNLHESVSEMEMSEDEVADAIDFNSIFAEDEKEDSDEVEFTDIVSEEKSSKSDDTQEVEELEASERNTTPKKEEKPVTEENEIRLAEDQYGMEQPLEEPEVETPHDYSWFIREMKNEISEDKKPEKPQPEGKKKPEKESSDKSKADDFLNADEPTGVFKVEEIGTSGIRIPEDQSSQESEDYKSHIRDDSPTKENKIPDQKQETNEPESKLTLAERLLVKELARKLADRIVKQLPRDKIHQMLEEVLSELKNY